MTDTIERAHGGIPTPHKGTQRRSRAWRSMIGVAVVVVGGFAVTGVLPLKEYLERGNEVDEAQAVLDEISAENAALIDDVEALHTDQEVERVAREQYGYVREGEIGYTVITPEGEEPIVEPHTPVEPLVEERPFLSRVWDFLTGRDQEPNG